MWVTAESDQLVIIIIIIFGNSQTSDGSINIDISLKTWMFRASQNIVATMFNLHQSYNNHHWAHNFTSSWLPRKSELQWPMVKQLGGPPSFRQERQDTFWWSWSLWCCCWWWWWWWYRWWWRDILKIGRMTQLNKNLSNCDEHYGEEGGGWI